MPKEDRVSTNIPGLDSLMQGGIPKGELILLSGTCGTGKTIFGLEFIQSKEPAIYISFEEHVDQIRAQAASFGWNLKKMEDKDNLRILRYDPFQIHDILGMVENNIREICASRVVIDSVSAFSVYLRDQNDIRQTILQIYDMLKKNKCTSVLVSEILPGTHCLSRYGMEEFVLDGVIVLRRLMEKNKYKRALNIWKLRQTDHSSSFHEYDISGKGFTVFPKKTIDFDKIQFYT